MANAGPHPALLLAEFSPSLAGFLDTHALLEAPWNPGIESGKL
jgi:hypothetical protein